MQTTLESDPEVSPVEVESDPADKALEAGLASLFEGLVTAESFSPEFLDCAELIRLQQSDPGLSPLFEQAEKGDKRYFVRFGVLRTSRTKLALPHRSIYQIVVPTTLRPQLLQIAHDGHLGVYKTRSTLLLAQHFS